MMKTWDIVVWLHTAIKPDGMAGSGAFRRYPAVEAETRAEAAENAVLLAKMDAPLWPFVEALDEHIQDKMLAMGTIMLNRLLFDSTRSERGPQ